MQVLYRKYRPKSFDAVVGQEIVKKIITKQLADEKVGHAYLFTGPRGVGKTTVARLLAKSLNCTGRNQGEFEPCNECANCVDANEGRAVDIVEIDAASNTGVDNVREHIIDSARYMPGQGAYKVFIIDEVHMLSKAAFNALLKTLEEPPQHVKFVLATTEEHKIPATILSRCQRMPFTTVAADKMQAELESIVKKEGANVDPDVYSMIIRASEGCMRDAESLLGQLLLEDDKVTVEEASLVLPFAAASEVTELIQKTFAGNSTEVTDTLNKMVERGLSMSILHDQLIDELRNLLHKSLLGESADHNPRSIHALLEKLIATKGYPEHSMIPQIRIEIALMECMVGLVPAGEMPYNQSAPSAPAKEPESTLEPEENPQPEEPELEPTPEPEPESEVEEQKIEERTGDLTLEEVKDKWQRSIKELGKKSMALTLALGSATPVSLSKNKVTIEFNSGFHFETMNTGKNIDLLRSAMEAVLMTKIELDLTQKEEKKAGDSLNKLADAFGGAILN